MKKPWLALITIILIGAILSGQLPAQAKNISADHEIKPLWGEVDELILPDGESQLVAAAIDPLAGYAYFGTRHSPGVVVKIRLSDFTRVDALTVGEEDLASAVIDPEAGYAYFGTRSYPGKVYRIRLSDFTVAGSLTLNPGDDFLHCAVIDTANGFAYFGLYTVPGKIVKVDLSDFSVEAVLTLDSGEDNFVSGVIDTSAGYAYFGTGSGVYPGRIVKISLADFSRADGLLLPDIAESDLTASLIDPQAGFAYFGTGYLTDPARVIKIQLSDFTRVAALSFEPGEAGLYLGAVLSPKRDRAYFGIWTSPPGRVVEIRLSDFTRTGFIDLSAALPIGSVVIEPSESYAYFATGEGEGIITKVQLNEPPVANAGPDQEVKTMALVTLDGSASSDPDGNLPLSYGWTQIGGPEVVLSDNSVVTPTFTAPDLPSVVTFTLEVTDSLGLAALAPDEVVVNVINQAPLANAGPDQVVNTNSTVQLDGSASSDPDNNLPLSYYWVQTGGISVTLSDAYVVSPTFTAPGIETVLSFSLSVTDSLGLPSIEPRFVVINVQLYSIYLSGIIKK